MKKIFIVINCVFVFVFVFTGLALAQDISNIGIVIDGENVIFDDNYGYPFIDTNSRTLVPFRITLEKFGASVSWNNDTNTATAEKDGIKVEVSIGKNFIMCDGIETKIDTSAIIKDGRTYLPIRAVLEAFGATVNWNDNTNVVVVENNYLISPVLASDMPSGVFVEILPRVELLSGVLSQTSWMDIGGPKGTGNAYFQELKEFFSKYKNHEAIKIAEQLTKSGFVYDAPPYFILSLGELPYLEKHGNYHNYLIERAENIGGVTILEKFRLALIDLAEVSDFKEFFNSHKKDYLLYINDVVKGFKATEIIVWQRDFFGWNADNYHTVLAPAMFPSGGYGAVIEKTDGGMNIYQVIRESGNSNDNPLFGNGESISLIAIHEWAHSYVNPAMEEKGFEMLSGNDSFEELFTPVSKRMSINSYGFSSFYNEQIIRAQEAIAQRDIYGDTYYHKTIEYNEDIGFYLTKFTIEQLEYYKENRDKYKNFKEFVPYLLQQYDENHEELLKLVNK